MLLGNCINGVALSLDRALTSLTEQADEIIYSPVMKYGIVYWDITVTE